MGKTKKSAVDANVLAAAIDQHLDLTDAILLLNEGLTDAVNVRMQVCVCGAELSLDQVLCEAGFEPDDAELGEAIEALQIRVELPDDRRLGQLLEEGLQHIGEPSYDNIGEIEIVLVVTIEEEIFEYSSETRLVRLDELFDESELTAVFVLALLGGEYPSDLGDVGDGDEDE